jgi:hypothetical protein
MCAGPKYEYRWADGVKVGYGLYKCECSETHSLKVCVWNYKKESAKAPGFNP